MTSTSFELHGPLPRGRLAIEASAGTGKTFTLATLAARYIAEQGVSVGELLIVTFTRAAAAELKDRVRARLVEFQSLLETDQLTDSQAKDKVASQLWDTSPVLRAQRLGFVDAALSEFDTATITTIHGFAQQVLGSMGSAVSADPMAKLQDDAKPMIRQVVTDVLVAEAVSDRHEADLVPTLAVLTASVELAMGNPGAELVPQSNDVTAGAAATLRRELVDQVCAEVARRRRDAATMSFDDLLVILRDSVLDEALGAAARQVIASRYRVAMIDEFQDTDPVQWEIFDALFGQHHAVTQSENDLILVGDPKQAIYAFRGANVHTYLQAVGSPGTAKSTLSTNWRSDPQVLRSVEELFKGVTFGDSQIGFVPVGWPEAHNSRSIKLNSGAPLAAMSIRLVDGEGVTRRKSGNRSLSTAEGAEHVFHDLVDHIRTLLETSQIPDEQAQGGYRPLRPDDVAVLVHSHREAATIRSHLTDASIPAVLTKGDDVLQSDAGFQWHCLLRALARPSDSKRARALALSWFGGLEITELAALTDRDLSDRQEQIRSWADSLISSGVASMIASVWGESSVVSGVLSHADGDREMTDLDHIGELLVLASPRRTTPAALLELFEQLAAGNDEGDSDADVAARRVESEASSVQIMTTFTSKGLEFPVVCCPTLWRPNSVKTKQNIWWDEDLGKRVIDIASDLEWGPTEERSARSDASVRELVGTSLRVMYVAMTRARHHTALWWLPVDKGDATGLGRVLFARDEHGDIDPDAFDSTNVELRFGEEAVTFLKPLQDRSNGELEVVLVDAGRGAPRRWSGRDVPGTDPLASARLNRDLPRDSRRWSFTAITEGAHGNWSLDPTDVSSGDGGVADEREQVSVGVGSLDAPAGASNPDTVTPDAPAGASAADLVLPLGNIEGGAGFGSLVHEVLEVVDFTSPSLAEDIGEAIDSAQMRNPWDVDRDGLVAGLMAAIDTPLGELFGGRELRRLEANNRLNELSFDFGLAANGIAPTAADIGELVQRHLGDSDLLHNWASTLSGADFNERLAGHLTGSIDLVARITSPGEAERYVVCDYKTNRVAPPGVTPTIDMFHPQRLAQPMAEAHYPLQALLYSVALHRYLRWRMRDYDPHVNLGGVGYLFVRGMIGSGTPTVDGVPHGVFEWHPPVELITELSDLLDGALDRTSVGVK